MKYRRNDTSRRRKSNRGDSHHLQSDMAGRESTRGMGEVSHHYNTKERRLGRMQQLQDSCFAKPRGESFDDGATGKTESADGTAFVRGAGRMQEGQKHEKSNHVSKAYCRED
jgi:hypothetical protein